jgi:hypothetical protein
MADLHVEADEEVNGVPTYKHGVPTLGTLAGSFLPRNPLPKGFPVERTVEEEAALKALKAGLKQEK